MCLTYLNNLFNELYNYRYKLFKKESFMILRRDIQLIISIKTLRLYRTVSVFRSMLFVTYVKYTKKKTLKHLPLNVHIRFLVSCLFFRVLLQLSRRPHLRSSVRRGTETPALFFFSYETFNLARVALLAIVAMIVGFAWLSSSASSPIFRISRVYGDNTQFSGVRGTRVVARHRFSPISRVVTR